MPQSEVLVQPASFRMAGTAVLALGCDFGANVGSGESLTSPVCTLTDLTANRPYDAGLSGSPTISGDVITQRITLLEPRHRYRLTWHATITANKQPTFALIIEVPF